MSQLFFSSIWVSRIAYLVEVSANPSLPILAEVCGNMSVAVHHCSYRRFVFFFSMLVGEMLTVADKGLVVLDRLFENKKSIT
jgi:hypothetical protein